MLGSGEQWPAPEYAPVLPDRAMNSFAPGRSRLSIWAAERPYR